MRPSDGSGWVGLMHGRSLSWQERRAVRRWIAESAEHARDLLRAEIVWRLSGALAQDDAVVAELTRLERRD